MPRETRSQRTAIASQRNTRSTQQSARDSEEEGDSDVSEPDQTAARATTSRQKPKKRARIEVDTSQCILKWTEKGLYDLPAIPSIEDDDDEDENSDSNNASLMAVMIMLQHHKKEPFTNNQLRNVVSKSGQTVDFEVTFKAARKRLVQDFGYILVEVTPAKPYFPIGGASEVEQEEIEGVEPEFGSDDEESTQKTVKGRKTRTRTFILINTLPGELSFINCSKMEFAYQRNGDAETAARLTVLSLSLLYIFMEGGEVSDEMLWLFLRPYGFDSDIVHKIVGNVRNLFNVTFKKQQYIITHHTTRSIDGPELCYYRWGPRADLEFSRMALLELCGKVFSVDVDMEHFGERYTNAEATEKRRKAKIQSFSKNL